MKKILIPPVLLIASILSAIITALYSPIKIELPFPYNLIGIIISLAGFVIMGKARDLLKKYKTTFDIEASSALVEEGIFAKSRNPMYLGMTLFITGISILLENIICLSAPVIFFLIINFYYIPVEEKLLEEVFGERFSDYKKRVGKWISH